MNQVVPSIYDAVILGAGPAGLSAAIVLAGCGWKVRVLEKSSLPREKVCGGFVGPENKIWLQSLGVLPDLEARGAQRIHKLRFTTSWGGTLRIPIETQGRADYGYGIVRKDFDDVLLEKLKTLGAEISSPVSVNFKEFKQDRHVIEITHMISKKVSTFFARHVIDARGLTSYQSFRPEKDAVGIAALFKSVKGTEGDVILHFADGGHLGMNPVSEDLTNVCYVADSRLARKVCGDPEDLFREFCAMNRHLAGQMEYAERVSPWKGVAIPSPRSLEYFDGRCFRIGDALTAVNPVVGGGISMAFASGMTLAALLSSDAPDKVRVESVSQKYQALWEKNFQWKVRLSRFWGMLSHKPAAAQMFLTVLEMNSWLFQKIFSVHHSLNFRTPHIVKETSVS